MISVAHLSENERAELFLQVAEKTGLSEAVVEKDFWVCLALDYLFTSSPYSNSIIFKGGTSLSKIYGLINRFSEDVDLILDWREIGYGLHEPWEQRSKTKQDKFNKESVERTNLFLSETFLSKVAEGFSAYLGFEANLSMSKDDQTILFAYPRKFDPVSALDVIRLEIGPLAAWTPFEPKPITSYAAEAYPNVFNSKATIVNTAKPERTFWEKATILHQEYYRPTARPMPSRYARHYYDLYMMAHSWVLDEAMRNADMLTKVRDFKTRFYPANWAHLELAETNTIRLAPPPERLAELERDYDAMQEMFIGDPPAFDELVSFMNELEQRIYNK